MSHSYEQEFQKCMFRVQTLDNRCIVYLYVVFLFFLVVHSDILPIRRSEFFLCEYTIRLNPKFSIFLFVWYMLVCIDSAFTGCFYIQNVFFHLGTFNFSLFKQYNIIVANNYFVTTLIHLSHPLYESYLPTFHVKKSLLSFRILF